MANDVSGRTPCVCGAKIKDKFLLNHQENCAAYQAINKKYSK